MKGFWAIVAGLSVTMGAMSAGLAGCDGDTRGSAIEKGASKPQGPVEIVAAPDEDDTAAVVQRELQRAKADGRRLLVYVGAVWCEPCERFHEAAKAGKLDAAFPGLRLLEFDLDRDRDRLKRAGYGSKMIPLFAIPREDGTGSGAQIEGGLKGDKAVSNLTGRLQQFLTTGRGEP